MSQTFTFIVKTSNSELKFKTSEFHEAYQFIENNISQFRIDILADIKKQNNNHIAIDKFYKKDGVNVHFIRRDSKNNKSGRFLDRTGETKTMESGRIGTIVNYRGAGDIDIQFEDGTVVKRQTYDSFKKGKIRHPKDHKPRINHNKKENRVGETIVNKQGEKLTIIQYFNTLNMNVQFEDGTIKYGVTYNVFKKRAVSKPDYKNAKYAIEYPNGTIIKASVEDVINLLDIDEMEMGCTAAQKNMLKAQTINPNIRKDSTTTVKIKNKVYKIHNYKRGSI